MNQQQSIGSHNQQQGLPDNRNQQTKPGPENQKSGPKPGMNDQVDKPAVTDDAGNPVNKKTVEAGRGYAEGKQTEAHSDVRLPDDQPENKSSVQPDSKSENVYEGKPEGIHHENLRDHNFPQQDIQEEKEAYENAKGGRVTVR